MDYRCWLPPVEKPKAFETEMAEFWVDGERTDEQDFGRFSRQRPIYSDGSALNGQYDNAVATASVVQFAGQDRDGLAIIMGRIA